MSLIEQAAEIVSSYVENNSVAASDLPALIKTVYSSLANIDAPATPAAAAVTKLTPAQIRKSVTGAGLVSFEDGKTYQTLKRHLTKRGMTLADYKVKWGLPKDYPTTAPAYAAKRSALAISAGLGRGGGRQMAEAAAPPPTPAKKPRAKKVKA